MQGLTREELEVVIDQRAARGFFKIEELRDRYARVRFLTDEQHLRPGGTVSGPALMRLTDAATYFAILAQVGPVFDAVTSNLNISFLRRPKPVDVIAEVNLIKLGKRLVFAEVKLFSEGDEEPVAFATCTYALPLNKPKQTSA